MILDLRNMTGLTIFKNFADQGWIRFNFIGSGLDRTEKFHSPLIAAAQQRWAWTLDRIRIGYPAGYLWFFRIRM